ncbi:MAG: 23S rRNA (pseudouridine(1915)-N(3))-methyltransferase RlmH [Rubrobacter sp.]|nr:23S rRNA (pseudouridine(1915)-N(3))-methyltransferase RlmH [Rubrobacter sp.]
MIRRCTIVAVGRLKGWPSEGSEDYLKRLRRYFSVEVGEVAEEDMNRRSREEVLAAEASRLSKRLPASAYVIVLDRQKGKPLASEDMARKLETLGASGHSHVAFVLGGPLGLAPELLRGANEVWSLGALTLPHALARVVLLEQIYRAVKISRGEKYHW